jgi:molybdate transport system regulatory protein
MKVVTKLTFLDEEGEKFFGEGPAELLHRIEEKGSLRAASRSMNMAYTKALKMMKKAEETLGYALTERSVGGKDGGGSVLTKNGKEWLIRYETYRDACMEANRRLYLEFFPEQP